MKIIETSELVLGNHVIFDVRFQDGHNPLDYLGLVLTEACENAGATVLYEHYHDFDNGGMSGVVLLAESHASVHYWPEHNSATFDIYMCGDCNPMVAAMTIINKLNPKKVKMQNVRRTAP